MLDGRRPTNERDAITRTEDDLCNTNIGWRCLRSLSHDHVGQIFGISPLYMTGELCRFAVKCVMHA